MKRCTKCQKLNPEVNFGKDESKKDKLCSWCKNCRRKALREYGRMLRKEKPEQYYRHKISAKKYVSKNRDKIHAIAKRTKLKLRMTVLNAYSKNAPKCRCCGERQVEFLAIDHIKNDGAEQRRKLGMTAGGAFYCWLKKNNFPKGFQVLCNNCNIAKYQYGVCPHKTR